MRAVFRDYCLPLKLFHVKHSLGDPIPVDFESICNLVSCNADPIRDEGAKRELPWYAWEARKDIPEFHRETTCFGRNVVNMLERVVVTPLPREQRRRRNPAY